MLKAKPIPQVQPKFDNITSTQNFPMKFAVCYRENPKFFCALFIYEWQAQRFCQALNSGQNEEYFVRELFEPVTV